jgi:hypothetical protein
MSFLSSLGIVAFVAALPITAAQAFDDRVSGVSRPMAQAGRHRQLVGSNKVVGPRPGAWRRLKGENQLPKVVRGVKFQNGIEVIEMPAHHAA